MTSATTSSSRTDVYTTVTNRIIEQLGQGVRPWMKPWNAAHAAGRITRPLRFNGQPYSGINVLTLWESAMQQEYECPLWLTFRQAKQLGGFVRKEEQSTPVVYASTFQKTDAAEDGTELTRDVPFLKQYRVFNALQCDGLPEHYYATAKVTNHDLKPHEAALRFTDHTRADIREGGNQACYVISQDLIRMPRLETFNDAESHAATLCHELIHWTRHDQRLHREFGRKRWGDAGYAMEELVAELGSAFLCADLGVTPEIREDHAAYIESWLRVLKQDRRAIFTAASWASKAVDYLHALQPSSDKE